MNLLFLLVFFLLWKVVPEINTKTRIKTNMILPLADLDMV